MNPYRTKLTFAQRCAIFAGHWHKGYNYPDLAHAFGVNTETIGKVCRSSPTSRNYKDVFRESGNLGVERMWDTYSKNINIEDRVKQARAERNYTEPEPVYRDDRTGTHWFKNSKGVPVAIRIEHATEIMKLHPSEDYNEDDGFMYWSPKWKRWARNTDEPWRSVGDVTRYFLMFPDELDNL